MINYALYKANRADKFNGKYYARAVHNETVDTEELAEHMSKHNCSYSKGQILGLLNDMIACIREITLDGNAVKLPNLGIFKPSISSAPADTVKDWSATHNVRSARMICVPSGSMRIGNGFQNYSKKVALKRVDKYDKSNLDATEGEGTQSEQVTSDE